MSLRDFHTLLRNAKPPSRVDKTIILLLDDQLDSSSKRALAIDLSQAPGILCVAVCIYKVCERAYVYCWRVPMNVH